MEGGCGHHQIERFWRQRPPVKIRVHYFCMGEGRKFAAYDPGEVRTEFDCNESGGVLRQRQRQLTGPRADLENAASFFHTGQIDQVVDQARGKRRSCAVI